MNQKELFPLFPPICYLEDRVLLIPPSMFKRLEGCTINDCRIFILVTEGSLTMQVNGKQQELKACTIYDTMDGINTRILQVGPDLKAYCLVPNRQFAGEALKNLKPGPPPSLFGTAVLLRSSLIPGRDRCAGAADDIDERRLVQTGSLLSSGFGCGVL